MKLYILIFIVNVIYNFTTNIIAIMISNILDSNIKRN
jgi:hypothetical protein